MTDFRQKPKAKPAEETLASLRDPKNKLEVIDLDISEIENAIGHLQRSNTELENAYNENHDPVYKETIDENNSAIKTKQKRIENLKKIKANLLANHSHCQTVEGKAASPNPTMSTTTSVPSLPATTTTTTTTGNNTEGLFL